MWRICTTCGSRTDAFTCEKDGTDTQIIRADTEFPGRLHRGDLLLDHYEVDDLVGVGGMAAVYRGEQRLTHQKVAIKVLWRDLANDPIEVRRFSREARAASLLAHPNAVRVYDFGADEKTRALFIIMEFLSGQKLSDVLRQTPILPPQRVVHIATQVCKALEEAHRKGIVHRDIKPDNIFLQDVAGEQDFAKILDFGLAKFITGEFERDNLTRAGYVVGSPEYMAPEQASGGDVGPLADIYSLGIVMYECLTGRLPFDASTTAEVLRKHILEGPERLIGEPGTEQIPPALEEVVLRCLAKDPGERPPTADTLRIQLLVACDRRRMNTEREIAVDGRVVAPGSVEESGVHAPIDVSAETATRRLLQNPTQARSPTPVLSPSPAAQPAPVVAPAPVDDRSTVPMKALDEDLFVDKTPREPVVSLPVVPGRVPLSVPRVEAPTATAQPVDKAQQVKNPGPSLVSDSLDAEEDLLADPRARPGQLGLVTAPLPGKPAEQKTKLGWWLAVAAALLLAVLLGFLTLRGP